MASYYCYRKLSTQQIKISLADPMRRFISDHIQPVKEEGKQYHGHSDRLDHARTKYASSSPNKPQECEENLNMLRATRHGFNHTAVNYVRNHSKSMHPPFFRS